MPRGESRIYRQAAAGSAALLRSLAESKTPFTEPVSAICGGPTTFTLANLEEAEELLQKARVYAAQQALPLSPRISAPVLAQAIGDYYFYNIGAEAPWLGTALKVTLANLWTDSDGSDRTQSQKQLNCAVTAAGLLEMLEATKLAFSASDGGRVEFGSHNWSASGDVERAFNELMASYAGRGRRLRVAREVKQNIMGTLQKTFEGVSRILQGEAPASVPSLSGMLLARIPPREPIAFWAGLWARLFLLVHAGAARQENPGQIVLLREVPWARDNLEEVRREALDTLYWTKEWRRRQPPTTLRHLIVERPIVTIPNRSAVTSVPLIVDSITWFIESSLFGYQPRSSPRLSDNVLRTVVSEPFEEEIASLFSSHGFRAGKVTEEGAWMVEGEPFLLRHPSGIVPPGEMDVLAVREDKQIVLLIECKVLDMPFTESKLRNLLSKVGAQDAEGFYVKLRKKAAWLREVIQLRQFDDDAFVSVLVLDRRSPGISERLEGVLVCDAKTLKEELIPMILAHE